MSEWESDLVVLVADKNMEYAVRGLLSRPHALGIRGIAFDIHVHVERDSGCLLNGHDFLRPMARRYAHALILFDMEGCGQEKKSAISLQVEVRGKLSVTGWGNRADVVVLDPELEAWIWSDSPHVERCLGWVGRQTNLRTWLHEKNLWGSDIPKPRAPKEALEKVLREVQKPRSSSLYYELAKSVSFQRCTDLAFHDFRTILKRWFKEEKHE